MAVDFPANPTEGDDFVANSITYRFSGGAWTIAAGPMPVSDFVLKAGDVMSGPLRLVGNAVDQLDAVPLRMVPQAYLHNGEFPAAAFLELDLTGYKAVQFDWQGAIPAAGTPSLRMIFNVEGVWYNSANQYQIMGWSLVGTTFTNNINSATESSLQLSRVYAAGQNNNMAGRAILLNGNDHGSARLKMDFQDANGTGNGIGDYWGFPIAAAMLKKPVSAVRLLWSGNQQFVQGGWLQAYGNKG